MAFQANFPTRIDEVLDFINTQLTNKIKNKVVWHSDNVPFSNLDTTDQLLQFERDIRRAFGINSSLPQMSTATDIQPGEKMDAEILYNKVKRIAYFWSSIRRVHIKTEMRKKPKEQGEHVEVTGEDTQYARLNDNYRVANYVNDLEPEFVALKNQSTNAQQLKDLLQKFYEKWEQLPPVELSTRLCHSSCHSNCHHR